VPPFAAATRASHVDELLDGHRALVARFEESLLAELPAGIEIVDAHVHLGSDVDGMVADFDELISMLERYGNARAFAFCLDEADQAPAFRAPNDRTLAYAERSEGRVLPFARLDLADEPVAEAVRCLDRGACGIKLHSRAQPFVPADDRLASVFALAAERRVPILIHGGQGLPPAAAELLELVETNPGAQLIVAHAGVADMANLASRLAGRAGVYFDTSVWSPLDLLDLVARVPLEQIVYASDYPYGQQPSSLLLALRVLSLAGASDDDVRTVLGGNAARIADKSPPKPPTAPTGPASVSHSVVLARIHQYVSMAAPLLWRQRRDSVGALDLAVAATEADDAPAEVELVGDLLRTARALWQAVPEVEDHAGRRTVARAVFQLVQLADVVAVTTPA
jgi:uncharacterized protein